MFGTHGCRAIPYVTLAARGFFLLRHVFFARSVAKMVTYCKCDNIHRAREVNRLYARWIFFSAVGGKMCARVPIEAPICYNIIYSSHTIIFMSAFFQVPLLTNYIFVIRQFSSGLRVG